MPTTSPKGHAGPADPAAPSSRGARTRSATSSLPAQPAARSAATAPATPATRPSARGAQADPARPSPDIAREAVIRLHAYALWERRGRSDGHAMEDWLQAEAELSRLTGRSRPRLPGPGAEGAH